MLPNCNKYDKALMKERPIFVLVKRMFTAKNVHIDKKRRKLG